MSITVVKRNGERQPYDANKINLAIEHASQGLDENITWVTQIASELELTLFDGITTQQLDEAVIQVALQNVKDDPQFDTVAARLLLKTIYKSVLGDYETAAELKALHAEHFRASVIRGVEEKLLDPRFPDLFDLDRLAAALEPSRDELLKYIGVVTLNNRYGIKARNNDPLEVPQFFWMRIAMGLTLNEADPTSVAIGFYDKMSKLEYVAAGSTLVNAGTAFPQLSNCFVMEMQDDMESIAKSVGDVMWLTKGTGGIGLSVTKLRAQGSPDPRATTRRAPARSRSCTRSTRCCGRSAAAARSSARCASTWRTGTSTSPSSSTCVRTPATRTVAPAPRTPRCGSATSS